MILLDSSAWLAHLFGEPGVEQVNLLFDDKAEVSISALFIDGLIASTAAVHDLTLVHRDPHLAMIPVQLLRQIQLPDT